MLMIFEVDCQYISYVIFSFFVLTASRTSAIRVLTDCLHRLAIILVQL